MCDRSLTLRALVNERLTAAAEEIFALVERTIAEYEEELCRSKEENQRKQELLDSVLVPQVRLVRTEDVQMNFSHEPSVKQEVPETLQIKEEPEEQSSKKTPNIIISDVFSLWDGSKNTDHSAVEPFSCPDPKNDSTVKLFPKKHMTTRGRTINNSSLLQRRPTRKKSQNQRGKGFHSETEEQTDNDEDWGPPASSSTAQMETEADGDHYNQVQIKDTSTAAHNSGLFSKYKCGAESRATVTEGHQSGTGAAGAGGGGRGGGGEKKYECSVCKKRLKSDWTLKRHTRLHTGERPYSCSICKKTFAQQTSLDYHVRVHTGEKPYSCTVCKKTFSQNSNLSKHMVTHTGGKPYSCTVCEKTFSQNSNLNIHMRIHTGERPYSCLICKKTFAHKVSLNFHMRRHRLSNDT